MILFMGASCIYIPHRGYDWPTDPVQHECETNFDQFASFRIYMEGSHAEPPTNTHSSFLPLDRYDWQNATFTMSDTRPEHQFNNVSGRIRGRGNSTWNVGTRPTQPHMQKWPFRIRFDNPISMLGSYSVSTDWSFIANLSDYTLMRNEAVSYMGRRMGGMDWQTRSRFVHVYFNGQYRGVYWLAEQLEVSNYNPSRDQDYVRGRVPLTYSPNPRVSEYFIELDLRAYRAPTNNPTNLPVEGVDFLNVNGRLYDVRFPDDTRENGNGFTRRYNTPAHMEYLRTFIRNVEAAIQSRNWARINSWIDVESFVDFYLMQEFFKDMDVGGLSVHMTIRNSLDGGRRLYKGPLWDFDLSAGNTNPSTNWGTYSLWNNRGGYGTTGIWAGYVNRWFRQMLSVPQFFELAGQRFQHVAFSTEYRISPLDAMIAHLDNLSLTYNNEFDRNFVRWNSKLGRRIWTQSSEIVQLTTHRQNVVHLNNWFYCRRLQLAHFFENGSGATIVDTLWSGNWLKPMDLLTSAKAA